MENNENNRLGAIENELGHLTTEVTEIKGFMKQITDVLTNLAVLESKHTELHNATSRAFNTIENLTGRVSVIEKEIPTLKLASNWVFRSVVYLVGILALLSVSIIFTKQLTDTPAMKESHIEQIIDKYNKSRK